jgi:hypothetical protein
MNLTDAKRRSTMNYCWSCGTKLIKKKQKHCQECGQNLSGKVEFVPVSPAPPIVAPWPYIYPPVIITAPDTGPNIPGQTPYDPYRITCGSGSISNPDMKCQVWM